YHNLSVERLNAVEEFLRRRADQIVEFGEDADKLIYVTGKSGTVNSANEQDGGTVNAQGFFGGDESLAFQIKANLKADPFITRQELAQILGIPLRTLSRRLKQLQDGGEISREGSDKKGSWKVLK
ncbi:MAG: winged helix-turn-helix transcriptional regulator, partial [bacterium]|nr:winged helix-turn-helix transcriptional regulator [Candidatus Colisoma equi]